MNKLLFSLLLIVVIVYSSGCVSNRFGDYVPWWAYKNATNETPEEVYNMSVIYE